VLWVFASIVVIEAIILIPSVYRREQELLQYLKNLSLAEARGMLRPRSLDLDDPQQVFQQLQDLENNNAVVGGRLYGQDGAVIGEFGEPLSLSFADIQRGRVTQFDRRQRRYDALWEMSPLGDRYFLVIRHDTATVHHEVYAFVWRIAGLVLIISVFVTVATMIVLDQLIISPVLRLRQDLLRAGETVRQDEISPEFESTANPRADELGDVSTAFQVMFQQISEAIAERKQAEAALRISEEKFAKAFRSSPNPVLLSTLEDGRLIEVNDSFLQFLSATADQVVGCTAQELNIWDTASDRTDMIQALQQGQVIRNREYQLRTLRGQRRTVLYSAEWIDINGTDCMLSVINDITERKQTEEALRESERRFRGLVEQAADAFLVVDADGSIVDVNQQACHSLGYLREELLTLTVPDIQVGISFEQLQQFWQELTPHQPRTLQGIHRRKDGTTFPVEVQIGLFEFGDRRLVLALSRDITERKQAEAALARLAEIGELTAMIVHEVRNPLTTVLMGLNALKQSELSERSQLRLQLALDESERLQRLLNEILLYAREQRLEQQPIELNEFLRDVVEALRSHPPICDRQLTLHSLPTPMWIEGDRDKLKQVIINLISNACEAVEPDAPVNCAIALGQTPNSVVLRTHNGGPPIPPDVLPNLTRPFVTTKPSGNGLGLAITKRIVEAHQGTLAIASSAQDGTIVTITLPLRLPPHLNHPRP
jgi:PAS domain S-box-containing protein